MELKFDEMSVDTSLVQEFLKNEEISKFINQSSEKYDLVYNGKCCNILNDQEPDIEYEDQKYQNNRQSLIQLADLIKTKTALIAQLEYHYRGIPLEVTEVQVNLLIQYINKLTSVQPILPWMLGDRCYYQKFSNRLPLLKIGITFLTSFYYVWGRMLLRPMPCKKETAAICCLLAQLSNSAGYIPVFVQYNPFVPIIDRDCTEGTTGVVTQSADVDSAVDAFISSSRMFPWELHRILVQENVYQQFKEALSWKCNLNKKLQSISSVAPQVQCSEIISYSGRVFVIDPLQTVDDGLVTVEAYRTTKELLSLLDMRNSDYLSLWANNVEEINEISYDVDCSMVWVNNLGDLRGPPQVRETLFSKNKISSKINDIAFVEKARSWTKLSSSKRIDVLKEAVKDSALNESEIIEKCLEEALLTIGDHDVLSSFVHVDKDYVCTGISQPSGVRIYDNIINSNLFISLVRGNSVVFIKKVNIIKPFIKYGIPVTMLEDNPDVMCMYPFDLTTKVVWSNKGTIFAN